jgi:hypothetical protein
MSSPPIKISKADAAALTGKALQSAKPARAAAGRPPVGRGADEQAPVTRPMSMWPEQMQPVD